jgi:hypothetical protein
MGLEFYTNPSANPNRPEPALMPILGLVEQKILGFGAGSYDINWPFCEKLGAFFFRDLKKFITIYVCVLLVTT